MFRCDPVAADGQHPQPHRQPRALCEQQPRDRWRERRAGHRVPPDGGLVRLRGERRPRHDQPGAGHQRGQRLRDDRVRVEQRKVDQHGVPPGEADRVGVPPRVAHQRVRPVQARAEQSGGAGGGHQDGTRDPGAPVPRRKHHGLRVAHGDHRLAAVPCRVRPGGDDRTGSQFRCQRGDPGGARRRRHGQRYPAGQQHREVHVEQPAAVGQADEHRGTRRQAEPGDIAGHVVEARPARPVEVDDAGQEPRHVAVPERQRVPVAGHGYRPAATGTGPATSARMRGRPSGSPVRRLRVTAQRATCWSSSTV